MNKTFKKKECLEFSKHDLKWTDRDLNPGPPPCQGDDLPSELPAQKSNKNMYNYIHFFLINNYFYSLPKKFKNFDNLKIFKNNKNLVEFTKKYHFQII